MNGTCSTHADDERCECLGGGKLENKGKIWRQAQMGE